MFTLSRRLALFAGVFLPVIETLRRWGTWWDEPPAYLDDLLAGALFLLAVWQCARDPRVGQRYLAAAWGFGCGMGYVSFYLQSQSLDAPDPSGLPGTVVVAIKGVMVALAIVGLVGALRPLPPGHRA